MTAVTGPGRLQLDLAGVQPGTRLLHNLSGGLDSNYNAWRLLESGYPLVMHHCEYRTRQGRWSHENAACEALLDWLADRGLTDGRLVEGEPDSRGNVWVRTTFDRGTAVRYPKHNDIAVLMPITGWVMRNPKFQDIQHVVTGHHRNSPDPNRPESKQVREIAHQLAGRRWTWLKPIGQHTKDAIVRDTPLELIDLSWWCRRPRDGQPCRDRCPTCKRVTPIVDELRKVPA